MGTYTSAYKWSPANDPQVRGTFGYDGSNSGYDSAGTLAGLGTLGTRQRITEGRAEHLEQVRIFERALERLCGGK